MEYYEYVEQPTREYYQYADHAPREYVRYVEEPRLQTQPTYYYQIPQTYSALSTPAPINATVAGELLSPIKAPVKGEPNDFLDDDEPRFAKYVGNSVAKLNSTKYAGLAPRVYDAVTGLPSGKPFLQRKYFDSSKASEWSRSEVIKSIRCSETIKKGRLPRCLREQTVLENLDVRKEPAPAFVRWLTRNSFLSFAEAVNELKNDPSELGSIYREESEHLPFNPFPNGVQRLSPANGRKKALVIGVTYGGRLKSAENDVVAINQFLKTRKFRERDIEVLCDGASYQKSPCWADIIAAVNWLTSGASEGDELFFLFSGLARAPETDRILLDHKGGTTLCPADYLERGLMEDDVLYELLVRPLPAGCRLTAVFDVRDEDTSLDLPYENIDKCGLICFNPLDRIEADVICFSGGTRGAFDTMKTPRSPPKRSMNAIAFGEKPYGIMTELFMSAHIHCKRNPPLLQDILNDMEKQYATKKLTGATPVVSASKAFTLYQPCGI